MRTVLTILSLVCWMSALAGEAGQPGPSGIGYAMGDDHVAAGPRAQTPGAVAGDLLIAGGEVIVVDPVGGDVVAAGGQVRIDAEAGQDVYSAGGRVALNAAVKRNARLAGGKVEIGSLASIAGNATMAGGDVTVLGDVQGELAVAGGRIYLDGRVAGNVEASGGEIELGPRARIGGNLHYRSPEALKRDPGAVVGGAVVRVPGGGAWRDQAKAALQVAAALLLIWVAGLMVVGAVFVAALPGFTARLADTARARPGASLLRGFVALIVAPAAVSVLMATGVGIPLGLLVLAAYLTILMLGYVSTGVVLGQMGLRRLAPERADRTGWRAAAASLAIMVLTLLAAVPVLGWLVWLAVLIGGMGALLLQLRSSAQAATRGETPERPSVGAPAR